MQTMAQVSKPITSSTLTPATPVQTQFLQKQLEQPLKMDNQNMTMQTITQHQSQNLPQIQQFQINQQPKPPQIVGFCLIFHFCFIIFRYSK